MKSKALRSIIATMLILLVAGYATASSLATAGPTLSTPAQTCSEIAVGAVDAAITACKQGYVGASLHAGLGLTCALGVGAIEAPEYQHDCKTGFIFAGGVTTPEPTPNAAATKECASITEGAVDGSPAACEQGYMGALAGTTLDASCEHIGEGAIKAIEYVTSCEAGWFVGKGEATCIPGADLMNGQPGSTIKSDAATDKTCSAA